MNLNGILIGSEDPARPTEYYTRLFGAPGWDMSGYTGWQIGSGSVTVGPHSEVHGANTQPGRIIWNIETPDVKGEYARLVSAGARVITEPYTMDGMPADSFIATFADPDDNYFQLMSPLDPDAM